MGLTGRTEATQVGGGSQADPRRSAATSDRARTARGGLRRSAGGRLGRHVSGDVSFFGPRYGSTTSNLRFRPAQLQLVLASCSTWRRR